MRIKAMELTALVVAFRGRVASGARLWSAWRGSSAGPQLIADPLGSMDDTDRTPYEFIAEFQSSAAAGVAQALLSSADVHSWLEVVELTVGVPSRFRLLVRSSLAHRARWILSESDITDRELTYLATGELDSDESI